MSTAHEPACRTFGSRSFDSSLLGFSLSSCAWWTPRARAAEEVTSEPSLLPTPKLARGGSSPVFPERDALLMSLLSVESCSAAERAPDTNGEADPFSLNCPLLCSSSPCMSHASLFDVGEKLASLNDPWRVQQDHPLAHARQMEGIDSGIK